MKKLDKIADEYKEIKQQIEKAASKKLGYDRLALNHIATLVQMAIDATKALKNLVERWLE